MSVILQIVVEGNIGSTGTMAESIGRLVIDEGWDSYIAYGRFPRPSFSTLIRIGSDIDVYMHVLETRLFDRHGLGSRLATQKLIHKIRRIKPDIIHLHHLHGYYINIIYLFQLLKEINIPVIWTFHDCWSFTGHCAHFDYQNCEKWKLLCEKCPQKKIYPKSILFDRSMKNYLLKKELFCSLENMVIVTPSRWLEGLVRKSFLRNQKTYVINNGIDTNVFSPFLATDSVREQYDFGQKFIILGVASPWGEKKGLNDFIELSKHLQDDELIVLVGLNKKQLRSLPSNIVGLSKTENKDKLVELYSVADMFMNPTWEDNFPTTNIEALSCGTPVVTYETGGSPESVDEKTGFVVPKGSLEGLLQVKNIFRSKGKKEFSSACRSRAITNFSSKTQFHKYIELYKSLL